MDLGKKFEETCKKIGASFERKGSVLKCLVDEENYVVLDEKTGEVRAFTYDVLAGGKRLQLWGFAEDVYADKIEEAIERTPPWHPPVKCNILVVKLKEPPGEVSIWLPEDLPYAPNPIEILVEPKHEEKYKLKLRGREIYIAPTLKEKYLRILEMQRRAAEKKRAKRFSVKV